MKRYVFPIFLMIVCLKVFSQDLSSPIYSLTTTNNLYGITFIHLLDNYLSPLTYDGIGFRYAYSSRKYLSPNNLKLSRENRFNINIAVTENPAKTSNISYLGMDYSWGLHYHFRPAKNVQLLAGSLWDIEFGLKANNRNQNNPMNIDLATNLNFSGMAIYDTRILKYPFRFQFTFSSPFLGLMFIPEQGESYYEIFELKNYSDILHFSSFHNKQGFAEELTIQVPLKHTTWKLAIRNDYLKYSANEMVFKRNDWAISLGYVFDIYKFAGRKNQPPANCISPNYK